MNELIVTLAKRYESLLKCAEFGEGQHSHYHLLWMCERLRLESSEWPIDKSNRWIGYIQGVMTVYGVITVEVERDFTRPLFHEVYKKDGIKFLTPVSRVLVSGV